MHKFIAILAGASVLALMAPSVFERYRSGGGGEEALQPAAAIVEIAAEPRPTAGRVTRLEADRSGHFRTSARLNGRAEDVMVDTGATYVAISEATARRLGVRLVPGDFKHSASTANGTIAIALAKLDRVEIGNVVMRDVEIMVSKGSVLTTTLLGMSFLNRLKSFGVDGGRLELVQ